MTTTPATGRCRTCGNAYRLNRDGSLRAHPGSHKTGQRKVFSGGGVSYRCDGCDQPPADAGVLPDTEDSRPDVSADSPDVRVGQIWQDNDKRGYGRKLRIEAIDATHADCREVTITPQGAVADVSGPRVRTRIRLDRFRPTSTGYRLIQDAP